MPASAGSGRTDVARHGLAGVAWRNASVCFQMRPGRAGRRPGHLARDVAFELFLLVSLLAALAAFGGDPERQGLRASVGLSGLPVPALLEHPDRLADPQPSDLNATELRARLGRHFDPRVVSVRRPAALRRRPAGPGGPGHQARHIIW